MNGAYILLKDYLSVCVLERDLACAGIYYGTQTVTMSTYGNSAAYLLVNACTFILFFGVDKVFKFRQFYTIGNVLHADGVIGQRSYRQCTVGNAD